MTIFQAFDWTGASEADQKRRIRGADTAELNAVMRFYDWAHHPESVIGWAAAQQGIELGAAVSAFFNGDPMRFNYVPRRDVPGEYAPTLQLLDSIFQRINAGFYLPHPVFCEEKMRRLETWMRYQREDAKARQRGRWVFDCAILQPILAPQAAVARAPGDAPAAPVEAGFTLKGLLKPLVG